MARGRMLNQSIAEDAEFNEMSIEAQLMLLRTLPFLDRDGLINGNASVLRGRVAPLLDLPKSMASIVDEWVNADLVLRYTVGKQTIIFFPSFAKNQIGMRYERETASTYPPPPGYKRTPKGLIAPGESQPQQPPKEDADTNESIAQPDGEPLPDECRNVAGAMPDELHANGIEENIKEKEENSATPTPAPQPPLSAPSFSPPSVGSTGDPYMDAAAAKFRNNGRAVNSWQAELNLRVAADKRVSLVNAIGKACGLTALMNGKDKDEVLCQVHYSACWFYESGYDTPEKIDALRKVYLSDEWRRTNHPRPSLETFSKFASAQLDELPPMPEMSKLSTNGNGAKPAGVYVGVAENLK